MAEKTMAGETTEGTGRGLRRASSAMPAEGADSEQRALLPLTPLDADAPAPANAEQLDTDLVTPDSDCASHDAAGATAIDRGEETLQRQAEELECLLPRLMRRMLTLERDHPAMELPLAQLRVCTILQGGPRTLSAIGEELNISVSATTQIADRLERVNLVERVCGQDDRRTKKLQLSVTGAEMMRSRREQRTLHAARALAQLSAPQREAALHALQSLMEAVNATVPPAPHEDPLGVRQEQ